MRPGEVLVLYTDGVTERLHPDSAPEEGDEAGEGDILHFGLEGITRIVREHLGRSAGTIAKKIVTGVRKFGGGAPFEDDVSVMVVKRLESRDYPPAEDLTPVSIETRR
jgi:sigma-B regulation protein RsbU (phosphoserine phosphatase)